MQTDGTAGGGDKRGQQAANPAGATWLGPKRLEQRLRKPSRPPPHRNSPAHMPPHSISAPSSQKAAARYQEPHHTTTPRHTAPHHYTTPNSRDWRGALFKCNWKTWKRHLTVLHIPQPAQSPLSDCRHGICPFPGLPQPICRFNSRGHALRRRTHMVGRTPSPCISIHFMRLKTW